MIKLTAGAGVAGFLAACQPQVVEKIVKETVVVEVEGEEKIVEVEKIVKETVVVTEEKVVEKVVEVEAKPEGYVEGLADIPRNRTLIMAGLGGEMPGGFTDIKWFNRFVANASSRSGINQSATEGLFYANMLNASEIIPWRAETYKYNDDYTTLEIKIRKGVEWSDGEPFTANDCVFTFEMIQSNDLLGFHGDLKPYIKKASAPDDYTFLIEFLDSAPRFFFEYMVFWADFGIPFMAAKHIWEKADDYVEFANYDEDYGGPIVTGPYRLVASTVEQKIWDVRPDWWAAKMGFKPLPLIERQIHLPGMNEITMAQMCIANEIDMAFSMTPTNMQLIQSQNDKFLTHCPRPPYGFTDWWPAGLGWNCMEPPFDDPDYRWAMSYVVNRDEIIKFGFQGYSSTWEMPLPDYEAVKPWMEGVKDLFVDRNPIEYNLAKSAAIMERKGWAKDNDGFWTKDGERMSLELVTFPQHPSMTPCIPIVTEQLRRGGFDATFSLPADFINRLLTGEARGFIWGHGGSVSDPYKTMDLYHTRWTKPTGESTYPFYRWSNPEFDALVEQMKVLPYEDERIMPLWREALDIWLDALPDTMLVQTVIQLPMNTTYWTNWPSCDNEYIHEGFWHCSAMLMWVKLQPAQA